MADDITVPGVGTVLATDDDGTRHWPIDKIAWGPLGTFNLVDTATGKSFPVQLRSATGLIPIGEPTDAKNTATDTTSVTLVSIAKQISASAQLTVTGLATVDASIVSATGVVGAGTAAAAQRVVTATDDPAVVALQIIDDWDETNRAAVNLIAGQVAITAGAGAVAANTPRFTHASDDPVTTAVQIMDDWDESDRAKVNIIVGQAGVAAGAGAVAATVQRFTLASDDPAVATLGATTGAKVITDATGTIQQYLRGLIFQWITGGSLSAAMAFQTSGIVTLQSNATGTTYNVFGSQVCKELTLINDTGTDLEIRQDGAGSTFILWSGSAYSYRGITNANQVGYRRKDVSNTQVTLAANWVA